MTQRYCINLTAVVAAVFLLLIAVAPQASASDISVFGKTYIRETQKPQVFADTFTSPPPGSNFTLTVKNGKNGSFRVSAALIWINGKRVVGAADFNNQVDFLTCPVVLQPTNEIKVELRSRPGDFIAVNIIGIDMNTPPVANAGSDQTVPVGETAMLDGSHSTDADGNPLTYAWSFISCPVGSAAILSGPSLINPTFSVDKPGTYVLQLLVNDGKIDSAPDTVAITTANSPPVADAGPGQSVHAGGTVTLDGSGSTDVDGDPLTFAWSLVSKPADSTATLSDTSAIHPTFVADLPGNYVLQLIVDDGRASSAPDSAIVSAANSAPVANAGSDQSVFVGALVTLNGSASSDADGDLLTFSWSLTSKPTGSTAVISDPSAVKPTFAVDKPGTYMAQLMVNDGTVSGEPDTVTISTQNLQPAADAGPDQTVATSVTAQLDGSGSSDQDGDPLTFVWAMLSKPAGSAASLSATDIVNPTFIADVSGDYVIQLIVNDGHVDSSPDTVTITTSNSKPVADAGQDRSVIPGTLVTLDGSASHDADSDPLGYSWSIIAAPSVNTPTLANPTSVQSSFTPDLVGTYVIQLIVNDGIASSDPDSVAIEAHIPADLAPVANDDGYSVDEDDVLTVGAPGALGNDLDPEGRPLSAVLRTGPEHGTLSLFPDGSFTYTPGSDWYGTDYFTYAADNGLLTGNTATATIMVQSVNDPPVSNAGEDQSVRLGNTATLNGSGSSDVDGDAFTFQWSLTSAPAGSIAVLADGNTVTPNFHPDLAGAYVIQLLVNDGKENSLPDEMTVTAELPPDPSMVAPPLDPTEGTTIGKATDFLYTGPDPIQVGVQPGTIDPRRVAVLRGVVKNRQLQPLSGVVISILAHPEYGETLSRADGMFDLAVNGGDMTVNYAKAGLLSAQRRVQAQWQDFAWLPDVILISPDAHVTPVDFTSNAPLIQVARGKGETDNSGTRQATMLFSQGTRAQLVMGDGSILPVDALNIRATEYTVGSEGPRAMPAELPPLTGYTYAVDISADEAIAGGARAVQFDRPMIYYVENFLGFPVGGIVPVGYYDTVKALWIPSDNGRVIRILSIANGFAEVDMDGNGLPAGPEDLSILGIADVERQKLAELYAPGQSLWRVPLKHLTAIDLNWPVGPPSDARPPKLPPSNNGDANGTDHPTPLSEIWGRIDAENLAFGETIPVIGTPFSLNYRSDRVTGRKTSDSINIHLSGDSLPASLKRIELNVVVAGKLFTREFPNAPNQDYNFVWDGKDAYGRVLQGSHPAGITINYVYDAIYQVPSRFGAPSGTSFSPVIPAVGEIRLNQYQVASVGSWDSLGQGLGGWTLSGHHAYDPVGKTLYLGDGRTRNIDSQIINTIAGNGLPSLTISADGVPATGTTLGFPVDVVSKPDGSFFTVETWQNSPEWPWRIRYIDANGIITTVAGGPFNRDENNSSDGIPATQAYIFPKDLAFGPDGYLYWADDYRVLRLGPDGIIATVVGKYPPDEGCGSGESIDGEPAGEVCIQPQSIAFGPDGGLYFADWFSRRIHRVGPDGIVTAAETPGETCSVTDRCGCTNPSSWEHPTGLTVAPDGTVYFSRHDKVLKISPEGKTSTLLCGTQSSTYIPDIGRMWGEGIPTDLSYAGWADGLAVGPDGSLYVDACDFLDGVKHCFIRRVDQSGLVSTIAGREAGYAGDGGSPRNARIDSEGYNYLAGGIDINADGSLYIADSNNHRIRRIKKLVSVGGLAGLAVPSPDGKLIFSFDASGRHLNTLNALTGAAVYQFQYDSGGRLAQVRDGDGNVTLIERDGLGNPTAITGPFGQRTALSIDGDGFLRSITNPASETYQFGYVDGGLLSSVKTPKEYTYHFTYDDLGRLTKAEDPSSGSSTLALTTFENGQEVSMATMMNRVTTYRVEHPASGEERRTVTFPDGTREETVRYLDDTTSQVTPSGEKTTLVRGPDPRFGMLSPVPKSVTVVTPEGLTSTGVLVRTTNLADPTDPLSLTGQNDVNTTNGRSYSATYNSENRSSTITTPAGRQSATLMNALGRITRRQIQGLAPTKHDFDAQGRLSTVTIGTGPDERVTTFGYNDNGFLERITDPLGRTVRLENDLAGRVTRKELPDGRQILYEYDAHGNLVAVAPPEKPQHRFAFTLVDLMAEYTPPSAGSAGAGTGYSYNPDRQLTRILNPDGKALDMNYDPAGRLSSISGGMQRSYAYDGTTGLLTSITSPDGTLSFISDGTLITGETWSGSVSGTVSHSYDRNFLPVAWGINGGNPVQFQYDDDKFLVRAGDLNIVRDANNGLVLTTQIGNVSDSRGYNSFGELQSYHGSYGTSDKFAAQYVRDKVGRVVRKVETIDGETHTYDYAYDPAGQLAGVTQDGAVVSTYAYDGNGNRVSTNHGSPVSAAFDDQDRIIQYGNTTYTYTGNGELEKKVTGEQSTSYQYDALGNLTGIMLPGNSQIEYLIDAKNRRIGRKVDGALVAGFLYKDKLQLAAALDSSGNITETFVYGTRSNVPDYVIKGENTYRIIADHLGSPRVIIDVATGAVAQRLEYDEYGKITLDTNPGFQPFAFAGGLYDPSTGLVHFGAREYDPETGRWISKDLAGFRGGQLNLYAYASNDPVNYFDPSGLSGASTANSILNLEANILGFAATLMHNDPVNAWSASATANIVGLGSSSYELCSSAQLWGQGFPVLPTLIHDSVMYLNSAAGFHPALAPYSLAFSWVDMISYQVFLYGWNVSLGNTALPPFEDVNPPGTYLSSYVSNLTTTGTEVAASGAEYQP